MTCKICDFILYLKKNFFFFFYSYLLWFISGVYPITRNFCDASLGNWLNYINVIIMPSSFSFMCGFILFIYFIIAVSAAPLCNGKSCNKEATVTSLPGHWPSSYCKIKNVVFNTGDRTLQIDDDLKELDKCHKVKDVWKFETSDAAHQSLNNIVCDQVFTRGHFFTTYYFHGSNYFHLNYDTMIPLYLALHQESLKSSGDPKDIALLPGIEAVRGEVIITIIFFYLINLTFYANCILTFID